MDDNNNDFLRAEYLHLQSTIEGFDSKALTIKAWSVTFSFTACGVAYTSDAIPVFLIAAISSIIFWFLEAAWKTFQYAYYFRIKEIERYFNNEIDTLIPFQIEKSWNNSFKNGGLKRLFRIMFWYHVYLPHLLISIIAIILFILTQLELIKI